MPCLVVSAEPPEPPEMRGNEQACRETSLDLDRPFIDVPFDQCAGTPHNHEHGGIYKQCWVAGRIALYSLDWVTARVVQIVFHTIDSY